MLNPISDVEKILLASMHPEGKAEYWYMDTIEEKEYMEWGAFTGLLMERFMEPEGENLIGDLTN